jgi:hypothetical protein
LSHIHAFVEHIKPSSANPGTLGQKKLKLRHRTHGMEAGERRCLDQGAKGES